MISSRCFTLGGLLVLAMAGRVVAAGWRSFQVVYNDFSVVSVQTDQLLAAGPTALCAASFDTSSDQFVPKTIVEYAGPAALIKRFGTLAIVESAAGSLTFVDMSGFPSIRVLGTVSPEGAYSDFEMVGNRLFLACGFSGVREYAVQSHTGLSLVDSSLAAIHAVAMTSTPSRLFVADDYAGVVDFHLGQWKLDDSASLWPVATPSVAIAGRNDSVFVATADDRVLIASSQPDSLALVGELQLSIAPERLELVDTFIVGYSSSPMRLEYVGLGGSAQLISADSVLRIACGSAFENGGSPYLAAPSTDGQIYLYNLEQLGQDLSWPRKANPHGGNLSDVTMYRGRAIVSRSDGPTLAFDARPATPTSTAVTVLPGVSGVKQVQSADTDLLLFSEINQELYVLGGGNWPPVLRHIFTPLSADVSRFQIAERLRDSAALLVLFGNSTVELVAVDTSWTAAPFARLYFPEQPIDVGVTDSLIAIGTRENLYVYSSDDGFFLSFRAAINLDASRPNLGALVRCLTDLRHPSRMWIVRSGGVQLFDMSDPRFPAELGHLAEEIDITDAAKKGDYVYAASQQAGLLKLQAMPDGWLSVADSSGTPGSMIAVDDSVVSVTNEHGVWITKWEPPASIADQEKLNPTGFAVAQNYPNPFNPATLISYSLAHPGPVSLKVYNVVGQEVARLVSESQTAGRHEVVFDGSGLATGIYLYRLTSREGSEVRKMVLVR